MGARHILHLRLPIGLEHSARGVWGLNFGRVNSPAFGLQIPEQRAGFRAAFTGQFI